MTGEIRAAAALLSYGYADAMLAARKAKP